jgi:peptidoglycan/xylan/chitin deacetylase (PgdA/CDA1 family)
MAAVSEVLALCYHAVSPTWPAPLSVTPDALERQLHWLVSRGWRGHTFADAVRSPTHARTLAITFDDGFTSVATLAYPILSSLGLPATVFVPTDYMSGEHKSGWPGIDHWTRTAHAEELAWMTWDTLGTLADAGWEIGSHTRTHPHLTQLDDGALQVELEASRDACTRHLDRPCETIAYPYGDVDDRVADRARAAGYAAGAALPEPFERLGSYRWPRTGIYHRDRWWRFRLKVNPVVRRAIRLPVRAHPNPA